MRIVFFATAAFLSAAAPSFGGAEEPHVAVTIYNNDLALVEDARTMDFQSGRQRLEFPGVSAQIMPETASLAAEGVSIVEQNFDFDLLTPTKMMEKAVGQTVKIVRTNPASGKETIETAKVLSANQGVVLQIGDRIEVLRDDGLPVKVLFDKIPDNLRAKPTLSVQVNASRGGARLTALRYLTHGLGWSADYVGVFDDKAGALDLQGWVTLTNTSGASYKDAVTQLVAGGAGEKGGALIEGSTAAGTGGAESDTTAFGDYHLYRLKTPTTIAENQTKQVSFISAPTVKAQKIYLVERSGFSSDRRPDNADVKVRFRNDTASGLGAALPAGTLRLYARDGAGRPQFIGEDNLDHTSQGSDLELQIGKAFDVTVQGTLVKRDAPAKGVTVTEMAYLFRNARADAATVTFRQDGIDGTHKLLDSSLPARQDDANTLVFTVPVPAHGEAKLTFTLRQGKEDRSVQP